MTMGKSLADILAEEVARSGEHRLAAHPQLAVGTCLGQRLPAVGSGGPGVEREVNVAEKVEHLPAGGAGRTGGEQALGDLSCPKRVASGSRVISLG